MFEILIKPFEKLNINQLYSLLKLRSEVFVVEQNSVYQDLDSKDQIALHVLGFEDEKLIAYTRIFKPGDYFTEACIGRVIVSESHRKKKYGYSIMEASIKSIKENYSTTKITISAQNYAKRFYNNLGFSEVGESYLEDGIPHIKMIKL